MFWRVMRYGHGRLVVANKKISKIVRNLLSARWGEAAAQEEAGNGCCCIGGDGAKKEERRIGQGESCERNASSRSLLGYSNDIGVMSAHARF
jgi:hypothetical protein